VVRRPTKTVGGQLFERPVIRRRHQMRIIRARTNAPEGLRRTGRQQAAQVHRFTVHGRTTTAGSSGNKLIYHGFGRSPRVTSSSAQVTTCGRPARWPW
jgi:hypothetical protein